MLLIDVPGHFKNVQLVDGLSPCQIWQMGLAYGYGSVGIQELNNKTKRVHHVMWFIKFGYWPKQLNHICNQKACGNTDHLYEGTQLENSIDKRNASNCTNQKLTIELVVKIRNEYNVRFNKPTQKFLAEKYKVNFRTISQVINGNRWI